MAEEPAIWPWLRSYHLLSRFPSIPQPGLNDPRTLEALLVIQTEYDAIDLEAGKP